jgi:hypothetical protein
VIPSCPDDWQKKVAGEHKLSDIDFGAATGVELSEYETRTRKQVAHLLDQPKARMRVQVGTLEQWLADGYLKTGIITKRTSGTRDFGLRLEAEQNVLGVAMHADESERPKYGYIHGGIETPALDIYGTIVVRFRQELLARARVLFGDSVGSTKSGGWASLAPVDPLTPTTLCRHAKRDVLPAADLASACDVEYPYAEIQIYGRLEPTEISDVVFHRLPAPRSLRRELDDWSIPFDETNEAPK